MKNIKGVKKGTESESDFLDKVNSTMMGQGITFADNGLPLLFQKTSQFSVMSRRVNMEVSQVPPTSAQRKTRTDRLREATEALKSFDY